MSGVRLSGYWVPGHELVDAALGMALYDAGDGAREIGLRIQAIELGGLDQGGQHRPVLGAAIGAGEEAVLAT